MIGTVRKNLRFVPNEMRTVGHRLVLTTNFQYSEKGKACMLLYTALFHYHYFDTFRYVHSIILYLFCINFHVTCNKQRSILLV